jgi:hypothetical protein
MVFRLGGSTLLSRHFGGQRSIYPAYGCLRAVPHRYPSNPARER